MSKAQAPMRWGVQTAAVEFGVDDRALSGDLRRCGAEPGDDGKYSTAQICAAVFGDYEQERTRLTKAQADSAEVAARLAQRGVVKVEPAFLAVSNLLHAIKRVVEVSELKDEDKDSIYREIAGFDAKSFLDSVTSNDDG